MGIEVQVRAKINSLGEISKVEAALSRLQPGKRRLVALELQKAIPEICTARVRHVPWNVIIEELRKLGIFTSVKTLKCLLAGKASPPQVSSPSILERSEDPNP